MRSFTAIRWAAIWLCVEAVEFRDGDSCGRGSHHRGSDVRMWLSPGSQFSPMRHETCTADVIDACHVGGRDAKGTEISRRKQD